MKSIISNILIGLILLMTVAGTGVFTVAYFHDGPIAIIAGGAFKSGELYTGPIPDWTFVEDINTVEFQLIDPERSRTTWIVEHEGRVFIPSGYMNTVMGKLWKHWPMEAEKDGRMILRVGGRLYPLQMERLRSGDILVPVLAELSSKYNGQDISLDEIASGSLWIFELKPR
ncbi:MAG: hypothetical protein KUG75_05445 [Pseudomonadales bacterium]|nr:hypothetical protein [Pseudomonadales bacterium]